MYLTERDLGDENDFVEIPVYAQPKTDILRVAAEATGVPVVEVSPVEVGADFWKDLNGMPRLLGDVTVEDWMLSAYVARFKRAVGRPPENDDLDRVTCVKAGEAGHHTCGWCVTHDWPRFLCGCLKWT